MLGAGHLRLTFDLEWFSANEPPHYNPLNDEFVHHPAKINLWTAGQLEAARRYLELLQTHLTPATGLFPQIVFYDCQGCHHSTDDIRWSSSRAGPGIAPGTMRLQKTHLVIMEAIAEAVDPPAVAADLAELRQALLRAGQIDGPSVRTAAGRVLQWIQSHEVWTSRRFSANEMSAIRRSLLRYAASDRGSDYLVAEQLTLGIDSVSDAIGDRDAKKAGMKELFAAIDKSSTFNPTKFAEVARKIQGQF
jgi:hypothetical protein